MPIPETPYTREEAYLNAIATGDSGGIPETPYTREEMYLDYIARNGGGGGGGSSTLSGLTDVDISNPSDGQTLVYNATSQKWENGAGGSSLLVIGGTYDADEDKTTLDKTWNEINNALIAKAAIGQIFIHVVDPIEWVAIETIIGCGFRDGIYVVDVDGQSYGCFDADDYPSNPLSPEPEDPELD